jgi:Sugar transferases involved in lipopolysaccharide synthesis
MQSSPYSTQTTQPLPYLDTGISKANDLAYIGTQYVSEVAVQLKDRYNFEVDRFDSLHGFIDYLDSCSIIDSPGIIVIEIDTEIAPFKLISNIKTNPVTSGAIIILLSRNENSEAKQKALDNKVNDIYFSPFNIETIAQRINFLIKFKIIKSSYQWQFNKKNKSYKMPVGKRLFDILVSSILLLLLSPVFIMVAFLIRLESRGPIIYKSKRAGVGYRIFDFYKFRSMVLDADQKLKALSETHNQYTGDETDNNKAFIKILNDPRITKVGNILRKTSVDELPQLINVLIGDMSLVGNRPLPLYEAEMLTSDQFAMRFLGPAGITGLWQISKRGKAEMSDIERKELDNYYAKYSSAWMDIKIMLKTIPAMLQKEKV